MLVNIGRMLVKQVANQVGPSSAQLGQCLSTVASIGKHVVNIGQFWSKLAKRWSTLACIGQNLARLRAMCAEFGQQLGSGSNCSTTGGQLLEELARFAEGNFSGRVASNCSITFVYISSARAPQDWMNPGILLALRLYCTGAAVVLRLVLHW